MKLLLGNCLDKLKELKDNSVDSIVTDPPYGLSFMGKKWDYDVPSQEIWEECLRVLKPGGHLLAFAGSRTYHRMAVRIEDAGFEIRDQIMWVYGSGFPKSLNIRIKVDEKLGNEREVVGTKRCGIAEGPFGSPDESKKNIANTKGNSEWEGWGTALKPAHEPIVMARKPFKGTVVDNVLEWGTGGINIDDSRIETNEVITNHSRGAESAISKGKYGDSKKQETHQTEGQTLGRFPANIIFDKEAGKILDKQSGISKSTPDKRKTKTPTGQMFNTGKITSHNDKGGASRFFYCPKASKKDRNEGLDDFEDKLQANAKFRPNHLEKALEGDSGKPHGRYTPTKNHHPTVKPTDLMLYLIRLVTPKNGTTLDPFMGSGSTGKAAVRGGFDFIGIEREEEYYNIANTRIIYESKKIESLLFNPQNPGSVQ